VVNAPVFTENVLSFAVPYGLALQGLALPKLQTNLLPQEIRMERLIRAKKPWAVGAAAALLLGTSVWMIGDSMQYRAVAAPAVADAMKKGDTVVKEKAEWDSKCSAEEKKIDDAKKAVKSIIAGQDERLNWIQLMAFVNEAIPQPNAENLSENAKKKYFLVNEKAQQAATVFYQHYQGKVKVGDTASDEEEGVSDRIQVNVEAVTCRYSPDLSGYKKALQAMGAQMDTLSEQKDPEGKGWVVELRGYTYHKDQRNFIIETLLDNLKRLRGQPPETAAEGTPGATPAPGGTPPAPAPATAQPPAATPPAATDQAAANAEGGEKKAPEDPVWNKVSHAILYQHSWIQDPEPNAFVLINQSIAGAVASAGGSDASAAGGAGGPGAGTSDAPSGMRMPGMGMMGGMGGGADGWAPLSGGGMGGAMGGMGGMGDLGGRRGGGGPSAGMGAGGPAMGGIGRMTPGGGTPAGFMGGMQNMMGRQGGRMMPGRMGMGGEPGGPPGGSPDGQGGAASELVKKKARVIRTEFIILFIWKEPTPSDQLRTVTDETPAAGSGGMGMGMQMQMGAGGGPRQ
jgi:hypothetical protein